MNHRCAWILVAQIAVGSLHCHESPRGRPSKTKEERERDSLRWLITPSGGSSRVGPSQVDWGAVWQRPPPTPPSPITVDKLESALWSAVVAGQPRRHLWVRFTKEKVAYHDGCNRVSAHLKRLAPNKLALEAALSTKMNCSDERLGLSLHGPAPNTAPEKPEVFTYVLQPNRVVLSFHPSGREQILVTPQLYALGPVARRWQLVETSLPAWNNAFAKDGIAIGFVVSSSGRFELLTVHQGKELFNRISGETFRTQDRLLLHGQAFELGSLPEPHREGGEAADALITLLRKEDPEYRLEGQRLYLRVGDKSLLLVAR
ncbi:MAG: META domain-containing protein [Polyangia bacterium]|jgi:hypothetical protein|nr:META domain-containing protein [Polyangia bacterium]